MIIYTYKILFLTHWLPCQPNPALTIIALSSTCDVIIFDQKRHHLYSNSAGGKALSDDAPIRVIGSIVLEILTKMLKNLSEKLVGEFDTHGPSVARISCLDGIFSKIPKLQPSPVIGQQLQQKDKKRRKRKGKKKKMKNEKPRVVGNFLVQKLSQNCDLACACLNNSDLNSDDCGRKGMLPGCK